MSDTRLDKLQSAVDSLLATGVRVRRREDVDTRPLHARPPHERKEPRRTILEHARWRQPVRSNRLRVEWLPVVELDRCPYCNEVMVRKTRDHVVPGDGEAGLVIVCDTCNVAKGDLSLLQFFLARRWLQTLGTPVTARGVTYWCQAHGVASKGFKQAQRADARPGVALHEIVRTPAMLTAFQALCHGQAMKVEFNNPFFRVHEALRSMDSASVVDIVAHTGLSATSVRSTLAAMEYSGVVEVAGRRGELSLYRVLTKPSAPAKVEPMTQPQNTPAPPIVSAPAQPAKNQALVIRRAVGVAPERLSAILTDIRAHKNATVEEIVARTGLERSGVYMGLRALVTEGAVEKARTREVMSSHGVRHPPAFEYSAVEGPFKRKRQAAVKAAAPAKAPAFMTRVQAAATKLKARGDRDELQALAAAQQALGERLDQLEEAIRTLTDAVLR